MVDTRSPKVFKKYADMALAGGAVAAKVIQASKVVTAEWVRLKCQFGCPGYNKRLCCPPYTPTPGLMSKVLGEYRHALIYVYDGHRDRRRRLKQQKLLVEIERAAFLDGWYKAFGLGAGPCRLCKVCDTSQRCKHSYEARASMESTGIDVYATARNARIKLEVVTATDETPRYINLLLLD